MTSLGQDEPIHTCNHRYTRRFLRDVCKRGSVGANIQGNKSFPCSEIETIFQNHLTSWLEDICNLKQDYKKFIDVYKEKFCIGVDKITGGDKDYGISNKEEKETL